MKKLKLLLYAFIWIGLVTACQPEEEDPKVENKLQAKAGADTEVEVNTLVTLNGSESVDGNGMTFTYDWSFKSKPANSQAVLNNPSNVRPTFTPDLAGAYVLGLKISNETGESRDEVTITATASVPPVQSVIIDADINEDRILENIIQDPAEADYIVKSLVNVKAKLTVKPGVVVVFEEDKGLKVIQEGKLIAKGTETEPVVFTGKVEELGYWAGIMIQSNSLDNEMTHVEVNYAASAAIYPMQNPAAIGVADQAFLKLTNSSVEYAKGYGLFVNNSGNLEYSQNYFGNNDNINISIPVKLAHKMDADSRIDAKTEALNYVQLTGDRMEHDQEVTWLRLENGTRYFITEETTILSGLRLEEGVQVRFNANKFLRVMVNGYLKAQGSNSMPIKFDIDPTGDLRWGGILFNTSSPDNLLDYVEIIDAGNGTPAYGMLKSSAVSINRSSTGRFVVKNTYISGSKAYGFYAEQGADIIEFTNNKFEDNLGVAIALPVAIIGKLTPASVLTAGNGLDAIEILEGYLNQDQETNWVAMEDGTSYFVDNNKVIDIRSGLKIRPGVTINFGTDALFRISGGYLNAIGNSSEYITFTGLETPSLQLTSQWMGILIQTSSDMNVLDYTVVSYGGSKDLPGLVNSKANIGVDAISPGKLVVKNSQISHSAGYGIAVETGWGATINADVETINQFDDITSGNLYTY